MTKYYWGICDCGQWGIAPKEFKESKHFLKCNCGRLMFLTIHDPKEIMMNESMRIEPKVVSQND